MPKRIKIDIYFSRFLNKHLSYYFGVTMNINFVGGEVEFSSTGKPKYIYHDHKLILVLNPSNGGPSIQPPGVKLFLKTGIPQIVVDDVAVPHIREGKSLFCKHVISAPPDIPPNMVVILVDKNKQPIGIGRTMVDGKTMIELNSGVAVRVKKGLSPPGGE